MNETLARAAGWFVAPARPRRAPAAPPDLVAVVAAAPDLAAVAGGVAADLCRRHRARTAAVCAAGPPVAGPALPSARAHARRLRGQDLDAAACGALSFVDLGEDPARVMWRAAAVGAPVVLALGGRDEAGDELLAQTDLLLLAAPPGDYADLALASLAALGPPVALVQGPSGFLARRAAALGLVRVASEAVPA